MLEKLCTMALALLLAYVLGLTIVNVVDKRLSEIAINIPKQNIYLQMDKQVTEGYSNYGADEGESGGEIERRIDGYDPKPYSKLERRIYKMDLWNREFENACFRHHAHTNKVGGECTYGPSNFMNPQKMNTVDMEFFKRTYRPIDMTLQDYVNWLWLYKDDRKSLPYEHLKNLIKLSNGEKLRYEIGVLPPPDSVMPSINAEDYYNRLYNKQCNPKQSLMDVKSHMEGYNIY